MGVRIIYGRMDGGEYECAVLYCSTSDWSFGPIFENADEAESFLDYARSLGLGDVRLLTDGEFETRLFEFRKAVKSGAWKVGEE